jgi:ABC-type multidrug transport system fused ATPase/permease subunit
LAFKVLWGATNNGRAKNRLLPISRNGICKIDTAVAGEQPDRYRPIMGESGLSFSKLFQVGIGITSLKQVRGFVTASLLAVGPDRPVLAIAAFVAFIAATLQTLLLFVVAMVALALSGSQAPSTLIPLGFSELPVTVNQLVIVSAVLVTLVLLMSVPLSLMQGWLASRAVARARQTVIDAFINTAHDYRMRQREGFLQQLIGEYCQHIAATVQNFTNFCVAGATLLVLLVFPLIISPKIAVVLLVAVCCCFVLIGPLAEVVRQDALRRSEVNRSVSGQSAQLARLADEITSFNVGNHVAKDINRRVDDAAKVLARVSFTDALLPPLYQFGTLAIVILFVGILLAVDPGRHPSLAALGLLMFRLIGYGRQLLGAIQNGSKAAPYVERIRDEVTGMKLHARPLGTVRQASFQGVAAQDVCFAFPSGKQVLAGVSITIDRGKAIGIIGASGEGKSTLASVIAGVRQPTGGVMTSGGVPLSGIAPDSWSQMVAIVPQDTKLIAASVADNIRFYRTLYSADDVVAAARAAHIHDEIMALPKGYDTRIGPGGRGFSGGQRQRLVIARALIGEPEFLILDEPSSALDRNSEALVSETLAALKGKTTIMIVTHRPATLGICDEVWSLDGGTLQRVLVDEHAA